MGTGEGGRLNLGRRGFLGLSSATVAAAITGCSGGSPSLGSPSTGSPATGSPAPVSVVSRWATDPWARGSYSALSPGTGWAAREVLAETLAHGRVALAGEYVATDFPATVNGAYGSGRRAARLVDREVPGRTAVIVGAGIAGLAAAERLTGAGWTVHVLEARDRIGGRIDTDRSTGVPLELGASWIHGITDNPITTLAKRAGLALVRTDWDDARVREYPDGGKVGGVWAAQDDLWRAVDRIARHRPPRRLSVDQALAAQGWKARTPQQRFAARTELVMEYGVDLQRLGAQALWEGDTPRGGDWLVKGGYGRIPELLARGIRVDLGSPVRSVRVSGDEVRVTTDRGEVTADAAVVTVPVAVLRAGLPEIAWPARTRDALAGITTGNLEKVFLTYGRAWWPDADLLQVMGAPGRRWVEWYPMTALVDRPVIMALAGGRTATRGPRKRAGVARQAADTLERAYR
ncbi:MAG: FAD-dependent oxidoreductase [Candidatus Nanopelagicales bacterium]